MPKYVATAWVHPASGGDDVPYEIELQAPNKQTAAEVVEGFLKKKGSGILDDYTIKEKI